MSDRPPINLFDFDHAGLVRYFESLGERSYRATQVQKWVHQVGVTDFLQMTDLSKTLRSYLHEHATIRLPEIVTHQRSSDGTEKWLLRVDAVNAVESVFIPEEGRGTLCISAQAGCAMNCRFCSTGQQGYSRDLTPGEILGQVWLAARDLGSLRAGSRRITNVVLMGMGEPLQNLDQVATALRVLCDDNGWGLARRRVTLSTSGIVPEIDRLATLCPVSLAVSLHAPDDALRERLMPVNRKYPIAMLLDACWRYVKAADIEHITFEYTMLDGVNDSPAQAQQLARLLRGKPAKVNLIPFNPFPGADYRRSPAPVIDQFREILQQARVLTMTRKTRGEDIDAACGQLIGRVARRGVRRVDGEALRA
jgi:23S rRNA (adenine2503-C2)-methyltransferase